MTCLAHLEVMEHQYGKNTCTDHTDKNPGLELSPSGLGIINDSTNEGVDNCVKHAEACEKNTNCGKSLVAEGYNIGKMYEKVHTYQGIKCVTAYCTETEANFIASHLFIHYFFSLIKYRLEP